MCAKFLGEVDWSKEKTELEKIAELEERISIMQESMEALEKRNERMTVKLESDGVIKFGECPKCSEPLQKLWNQRYCGECGQAVKWE